MVVVRSSDLDERSEQDRSRPAEVWFMRARCARAKTVHRMKLDELRKRFRKGVSVSKRSASVPKSNPIKRLRFQMFGMDLEAFAIETNQHGTQNGVTLKIRTKIANDHTSFVGVGAKMEKFKAQQKPIRIDLSEIASLWPDAFTNDQIDYFRRKGQVPCWFDFKVHPGEVSVSLVHYDPFSSRCEFPGCDHVATCETSAGEFFCEGHANNTTSYTVKDEGGEDRPFVLERDSFYETIPIDPDEIDE